MQDISTRLRTMKRPNLLVQAANFLRNSTHEDIILDRAIQNTNNIKLAPKIFDLLEEEYDLNHQRKTGHATYCVTHHINVLAAVQIIAQRYL